MGDVLGDVLGEGDRIVLWESSSREVDNKEAQAYFEKKIGAGGTQPTNLVQNIKKNNIDVNNMHLVLVTDGEVNNDEVDNTDKLLMNYGMFFGFTTVYIIEKGFNLLIPFV
jgi:hypothetical protein